MMRLRALFLLLAILFSADAGADFEYIQMSDVPGDYTRCAVASSPDGVIVTAWDEMNVGVWTRSFVHGALLDPVFHGVGGDPSLCWSPDGFVLAWATQYEVRSSNGDGDSWSDVETVFVDWYGQNVQSLQLTGWQLGFPISEIFLAIETRGENDWSTRSYCVERHDGDWGGAYQYGNEGDYIWRTWPQAQPVYWGDTILPRVYLADDTDECLDYFDLGGMFSRSIWPDELYFGGIFDTAAGPQTQHVLGCQVQPICPCNRLFYCHELAEGAWSEPEELTVDELGQDWPRFPAMAVDAEGGVHTFWYQEFDYAAQSTYDSYYMYKPAGGDWEDRSEILGAHVCRYNDITLDGDGQPVIVFQAGDPDPTGHVLLGHDPGATSTEAPAPQLSLDTWPNPFNPRAWICFRLPMDGFISLSIHDAAGRRVKELASSTWIAGSHELIWDGRDDLGRDVPSGVYLVLLKAGSERARRKIALIR